MKTCVATMGKKRLYLLLGLVQLVENSPNVALGSNWVYSSKLATVRILIRNAVPIGKCITFGTRIPFRIVSGGKLSISCMNTLKKLGMLYSEWLRCKKKILVSSQLTSTAEIHSASLNPYLIISPAVHKAYVAFDQTRAIDTKYYLDSITSYPSR